MKNKYIIDTGAQLMTMTDDEINNSLKYLMDEKKRREEERNIKILPVNKDKLVSELSSVVEDHIIYFNKFKTFKRDSDVTIQSFKNEVFDHVMCHLIGIAAWNYIRSC
jgi:hypothetical protein